MATTKIDGLNATGLSVKLLTQLPTTPQSLYGTGVGDVDSITWRGGEMVFLTTDSKLYVQTATSGLTATWKRCVTSFTAV